MLREIELSTSGIALGVERIEFARLEALRLAVGANGRRAGHATNQQRGGTILRVLGQFGEAGVASDNDRLARVNDDQPVIVIEPAKQNAAVMERERVGKMIHFDGAFRTESRHATVAKINVAAGIRARAEEFPTKNTLVCG